MNVDDFSQEQRAALDLLWGEGNVFLTGEAGSGKSTVLQHFVRFQDAKTFPVLASTGAAAVLIGGRTFHSFMGLGIMEGGRETTVMRALRDRRIVRRLQKAQGVIIDEISMLSGETLETAEEICRMARGKLNQAWGGMRVVAVGDFAQLPPVDRFRRTPDWGFNSRVWRASEFKRVILTQNMRTQDEEFLKVLNFVRRGEVNNLVRDYLDSKVKTPPSGFDGTRLFPRRVQTDSYNLSQLKKIDKPLVVIESEFTGKQQFIRQLKKYSPLPDELSLKLGALVMIRQNDPQGRWVNGSTGTLLDIEDEHLVIELLTGRVAKIKKAAFSLFNNEGIPVATVTNFPISLAYAATIHKAQGITLDKMVVNLHNLWEPGQAYVALSRVRSGEHLYLEAWNDKSIKSDREVEDFYRPIEGGVARNEAVPMGSVN